MNKKVKKFIPVMVDQESIHLVNDFIESGGIFNFNRGVLLEPLFEKIYSEHFGDDITFENKSGYDYIGNTTGIKIEHKVFSLNNSSGDIKGFGDAKNEADYLGMYHPTLSKLFILPMAVAKEKFRTNFDKSNLKYSVAITDDLKCGPNRRKNSKTVLNTQFLLDNAVEIDTTKRGSTFNLIKKLKVVLDKISN